MRDWLAHLSTVRAGDGATAGLVVVATAAVAVEFAWRRRSGRGYDLGAAATTLGVGVGNLVASFVTAGALSWIYDLFWRATPIHWPLADWRTWVAGFLAVEFAYYWHHRASHTVRWLWANHAVHHSAKELTFLSAIRLGWTNLISGGWLFYLPLISLGFDPRLVLVVLAIDLHYQFFLHTEAVGRLGPLEWVLNTPSHHRVHHGRNPCYLDRNYGGMVIIFDRLFGTFAAERPEEPVEYGLVHGDGSRNPFQVALGEWTRIFRELAGARRLSEAARIAFGRPA